METGTMGRVLVSVKIENLGDLILADKGLMPLDQVRSVVVDDALVDTGATNLALPKSLITQLGLFPLRQRPMRTSAGVVNVQVYAAVRLTVQGRDCVGDVTEVPDGSPVLIGQVPLELLDFVVDRKNQKLIGNPEHGGVQMLELFSFFPRPQTD